MSFYSWSIPGFDVMRGKTALWGYWIMQVGTRYLLKIKQVFENKRAKSSGSFFYWRHCHPPTGSFALSQYPIDPRSVLEECTAIDLFKSIAYIAFHMDGLVGLNERELVFGRLSPLAKDVVEQPVPFEPDHPVVMRSGRVVGP
jgi:hypothetical protein